MSLYDARHTAGYKSSKLVQVCALLPEFHKEYPDAHITVKHVDFTGNRILFEYKDEKYFSGHHGDIEMDLDAFTVLLDDMVQDAPKKVCLGTRKCKKIDLATLDQEVPKEIIKVSFFFMMQYYDMNINDFQMYLDRLCNKADLITDDYKDYLYYSYKRRFSK